MCGIVGILQKKNGPSLETRKIRLMGNSISHRGPDDEGYFVESHIALGNRRLSVIDLHSGKQPISTADRRYTIVYNGEIFNYRTLQKELQNQGIKFFTNSDTEVVLAGFARYGFEFFDRMDGMFSLLIYDSFEQKLHAARDPFGIKPLYISQHKDSFFFASEIRAILKALTTKPSLNLRALGHLFQTGYVPGRETFFEGIEKIPPGTFLTIDSVGGMTEESFARRLMPQNLARAQGEAPPLKEVLQLSIQRSLVADVPVGLYLSGGIDSSLIASIVSRDFGLSLQSYSISFPKNESHNESHHAEKIASILGLKHETFPVFASDFQDIRKMVRITEEPLVDASSLALLKLSENASKTTKVVLSGEGGDEFFGGYHRYFWDRFVSQYTQLPELCQKTLEAILFSFGGERLKRRIGKLQETKNETRAVRYLHWFSPFSANERKKLFDHLSLTSAPTERLFESVFSFASPLEKDLQAQWVDMVTFLRDHLLIKADKVSMANSLEVRVPFLQADVVKAAYGLTVHDRYTKSQTKVALRQVLSEYLPREVFDRPKQGFEVPLARWFREELREKIQPWIAEDALRNRGLIPLEVAKEILKSHEQGEDRSGAILAMCCVEAWCQEFLDS